ncbi:MAG: non-hydrolyzing UDP-N-acetylglucosamine 2-epimerase [Actinomycetota bacterium]
MGKHTAFTRLSGGRSSRDRLRLLVVLGTRPEIVKLGPVVVAARAAGDIDVRIVSSGQHPPGMLEAFRVFDMVPDVDLGIFRPGGSLAELLERALEGAAHEIARWTPDVVMLQGDTTTALAGAIAGFYAGVPVAHVEAGLRTNDMTQPYPEEMNRRASDSFAQFLFAPTRRASMNILVERARKADVFVTGNTVVDAALAIAHRPGELPIPAALDARANGYAGTVVVTVHRRESWGRDLDAIANGIAAAARRAPDRLFVVPLHPNPIVRGSFEKRAMPTNLVRGEPLPYAQFVRLLEGSELVVTDSGGVVEEATSFGKPVLILRRTTERVEAVEAGVAEIVGVRAAAIESAIRNALRAGKDVKPAFVFGDGRAGERIVGWLRWYFGLAPAKPKEFSESHERLEARQRAARRISAS